MAPRETLDGLLGRASVSSRVQFVAALYEARGFAVSVDGPVVTAGDERILVAADSVVSLARLRTRLAASTASVDRVFAVDETRATRLATRYDAAVLTSSDLDSVARYGLPRRAADALFERSFDRPLSAIAPPVRDGGPTRSRTPTAETPPVRLLGVVVALVVVLATGLGGLGVADADAAGRALPWSGGGFAVETTVNATTPAPTDPTATATPSVGRSETDGGGSDPGDTAAVTDSLAPGVSATGLTDVNALAVAHEAALANRSYRWELSYVETVNGTVTARGTERVAVQSPRRFASTVSWTGTPVGFSPVASHASYADGQYRHRLTGNAANVSTQTLNDVSVAGEQAWRASRAVRWYLSASTSSLERTLIHAQTPTVVLVGNGTTYPALDDYRVRAHVTSEGLVQSLSVSYVLTGREAGPPVAVRFTFRYRLDDDVTASAPLWYAGTEQG